MEKKIWLSLAHMGGEEQRFIKEAFDTNWVVPLGPNVDAFEQMLQTYVTQEGEPLYAVALSSGTAAIHLALILLDVHPNDEVICQSFTFSASANPIVYQGAKPIFVDSEEQTWNMSPKYLEKAIVDRKKIKGSYPKAIIPVHLYGMPAMMDEILSIAAHYEIPVIEDAAEALGSIYKGRKCGSFGHFGILSFNGNKIITTSGGGALLCKKPEHAQRAKFFATQARENRPYYHHEQIGYNYRMSNVCAGIGRGQMLVLDEHMQRRKQIHQYYVDALQHIPGLSFMERASSDFDSNYWLTCMLVDEEKTGISHDAIRIALDKANIESRLLWKPMHKQPVFSDCPFYGESTSEKIFNQGLCLPSGSSLSNKDIDRVVNEIKKSIVNL
ncbi:MAG: DegT/DnrJ/EryC1/StrS family aminotransferase [Bacteroidales bacterium]|jgi:dTDP-4-amino-4,6-dideoxygalactose transaminase|nr:DegT/DnrJ/EryC1/StrS family aminotransferase [Bacteroidales bacterium]MDD3330557.1 DegT/DnrJ/EryC1/StrS family aminotransferase [Bacteroidales bacterium]MDD3691484.1 DegT/DnrJ/EryC1/StrS family aminotransferase [Bacteroidales bacterium]MDD4045069.1 DegT/DnrJ/EryC1/StrS family aminotransferase [Bacteroidales bacterium]